ncbi:MAG: hypothetical protein IPJ23_16465 [Ignavibacteriales bacterium]|nr:hypothetical protein [Ignavibacteriales bacterium]
MKVILNVIFILILSTCSVAPQGNDYWKNAPISGSKIYSIYFTDQKNGIAISATDEIFITKDSGKTWEYFKDNNGASKSNKDKKVWSADIYCSVLQTTDGGSSWLPYTKEMQEHFCKVYLKDPNVDYKTASEFLAKVTNDIFDNLSNNRIEGLINHPKQCTEYYSNENEGWALGWCIKKFMMNENNKD